MHSRIFQITTSKVDKENYLNEDTFEQGCSSFYDYCSEITEEERRDNIDYLVNHVLPQSMFEPVDDNTFRYIGGAEEWKREFVDCIHKKVDEITSESALEWIGPVYQLEKTLKNPLNTSYHFYMDEDGFQSYAEESYEFMQFVCKLEPGTLLHIGGVIDYHF